MVIIDTSWPLVVHGTVGVVDCMDCAYDCMRYVN